VNPSTYFPKNALIVAVILIFISPIFGVILADIVGFREPLDVAAEELNLPDWTEDFNWTPFLDYTIPGLSAEIGYIIAGFIGFAIILGTGLILTRLSK
jgi:cobalt/nickel transport protein